MGKISDFTFSTKLRKEVELMDFIQEVRNAINAAVTAQVAKVESTGQTGDIASTTIFIPDTEWFFRVSVYMITTTTGTGTLTCTIAYTDPEGAKTISPAASVDLSDASGGSTGNEFIVSAASAISFSTAIAGKAGNPQYAIYILLEQIG
ncbi:hypothetical protein LCGC14_2648050 [marine sediment metagenome]|uniref:Uncharacterized protein n=1 Tax=marine sediment metagenome TaxID=412755 RepID=A0A0F8ZVN1_9ZZZZ